MDKAKFKIDLVDKLEKYLRDRMRISDKIRFDGSFDPITLDELDKVCLEHNDVFNAPEKFDAAKKTKLSDDEFNKMFDYVREYLLNHEIEEYPDPRVDGHIFMDIFEEIEKRMSPDDERYEEVNKYLRCTTAMRFDLINYEFRGFIGHISGFEVSDNSNERFIYYSESGLSESFIKDFAPIMFHDDIRVCTIENLKTKETKTILGLEQSNGYYSLMEEKLYSLEYYTLSEEDPLNITLEELLNLYQCEFLKRKIYKKKEIPLLWLALIKFRIMSEKEKEELDNIATIGAYWWLYEYKTDFFESNILEATLIAAKFSKEFTTTDESEAIYVKTLKNSIKRELLESGRIHLSAEYTVSDDLCDAMHEAKIKFNPVFAEMEIEHGEIKVKRGLDSYRTIYPQPAFVYNFDDEQPTEGSIKKNA